MNKLDWDNLGFSLHPTKFMYVAQTTLDAPWQPGQIQKFANLSLSPAAGVLNYGQSVFEGMKAQYNKHDEIIVFRPKDNAKRLAMSAKRICIPPVPESLFLDAINQVALANSEFIPPCNMGTLYIRPLLIGDGALLGNAPASHYQFIVFCSPAGNYFKGDLTPISVDVCYDHARATPKGTGHAKYAGNYAGCYQPNLQAKQRGYSACIFLDACHSKYIEEAGSANIFLVKNNTVITPSLGSILPGITRDSIITLARDLLGLNVEERLVTIDEALDADECFCTGTAAIITPIGIINNHNQHFTINNNETGPVTKELYTRYRAIQTGEHEDRFSWVTKINSVSVNK